MWRCASRARATGDGGRNRPVTSTRSPARRGRSELAAAPWAHASTRRRPRRTSARTEPPNPSTGSPSRVTSACTVRGSGGTRPSSARAARPDARTVAPTTSSHGRRRTTARAPTPRPTTGDTETPWQAATQTATARTTTARSLSAAERAGTCTGFLPGDGIGGEAPGSTVPEGCDGNPGAVPRRSTVTSVATRSRGPAAARGGRRRCPGRRAGRRRWRTGPGARARRGWRRRWPGPRRGAPPAARPWPC